MIIDTMLAAAIEAAEVILEIYGTAFSAEAKADGSPVTEADGRAEAVILEHLRPLGLPVLAEESVSAGDVPVLGSRFFVVDPLDGTKEFLKRNGEFTVKYRLGRERFSGAGRGAGAGDRSNLLDRGRGRAGRRGGGWQGDGDAADRGAAQPAAAHRGQPLARAPGAGRTLRAAFGGRGRVGRLLAQILPAGRRDGAALPAVYADM